MLPLLRARLLPTWLVVAVVDGLFASALAVLAYGSTASRLWQGVAATVLGPAALAGGARTVGVGLLLHLGVALGWSAAFLAALGASDRLRRVVATPGGVAAVALVYGPAIWLAMSLVVIPLLTGRPPAVTARWWVQLLGHVPFVSLPIVVVGARGVRRAPDRRATPPAAHAV